MRGYLASERTHYPLALAASPGARLGLRIAHDRRRFSDATVERMLRHLEVLLDAFVAARLDTPLGALPLPDDTERRRLLAAGCGAPAPALEDSPLLHELVEAQVERTPEATAVVFGDEQLSYRELDRRANRLAWRLRALGVGPDDRVGVCLERSPDLVVALLGILKAGGAYVPLDPDHPTRRLAWMLEDAQVRVLIAAANGSDPVPDASVPRLRPSRHDPRGMDAAPTARPPASEARPGSLAYVLYTSGSTGTPKGAMIPHSAIVNHMQWMQAEFPLDADDAVLQKTPVGFDASVWEFWAPLLAGGRLVLAQPGGHRDGATLVEAVARHRVSVLQVVPTLLHVLLDEPGLSACSSLDRVFSGGEPLRRGAARSLPGARGCGARQPVRAHRGHDRLGLLALRARRRGGPACRSAARCEEMRAYVLDRDLHPVPVGVPGELYLGGAGLGRGYLDRPGSDGGALRARSVRRRGRGADVPDRRPRALRLRRQPASSCGAWTTRSRCAATASSWARSRPCSRSTPACARRRSLAARGRDGRPAPRGVLGAARPSRRRRRPICALTCQARLPEPHGAVGLRAAGRPAAHAQRQGRPPRPARTGRGAARPRRRRTWPARPAGSRRCAASGARCSALRRGSVSTTTSSSWAAIRS